MNRRRPQTLFRWTLVLLSILLAAAPAPAQESSIGRVLRQERENIADECDGTQLNGSNTPIGARITGCGGALVHGGDGLYPSFTSLPPSNGLALGAVFKYDSWHTASWRNAYQAGAEMSFNRSWSAGGFLDLLYSGGVAPPSVITGPPSANGGASGETHVPRLSFYGSNTVLRELTFYGIGAGTPASGGAVYGFAEKIIGGRAVYPLGHGFEVEGEINGRWPTLAARTGADLPSIETLYSVATAPGLNQAPGYLQLGQALAWTQAGARWSAGWRGQLREYNANNSLSSDFRQFRLDAKSQWKPFLPPGSASHPATLRQIALNLRFRLVESVATGGNAVPFYFQPTLGGSDLNKERSLPNYPDYRFRAANSLWFSADLEQPLPKWNFVGLTGGVESGKVADRRGDLRLDHMLHSWNAGITLRFGNFPFLKLVYAFGGEGAHGYADVNLSALGGGDHGPLW